MTNVPEHIYIHALLLEADPKNSLGGSCVRDLFNMANHLHKISDLSEQSKCNGENTKITISNITVLTNHYLGEKNIKRFPKSCIFDIIYDIRKQLKIYTDGIKRAFKSMIDDADHSRAHTNDTNYNECKLISLVHISGHGYQTSDRNGDELDGRDEMICVNHTHLLDDDLHDIFIKNFSGPEFMKTENKNSFKFVGITDTCHSGTMFDLNYSLNTQCNWQIAIRQVRECCDAVAIGACTDAQLDSCDVGNEVGFGGALSIHLIENNLVKKLITGTTKTVSSSATASTSTVTTESGPKNTDYTDIYLCLKPIFQKLNQEPVIQCSFYT